MSDDRQAKLQRIGAHLRQLFAEHSIPGADVIHLFCCRGQEIIALLWEPGLIHRWASVIPDEVEGIPVRFVQVLSVNLFIPSECAHVTIERLQAQFRDRNPPVPRTT